MKNRSSMIVFRKCRCKDFAGIVFCFDSFGPRRTLTRLRSAPSSNVPLFEAVMTPE